MMINETNVRSAKALALFFHSYKYMCPTNKSPYNERISILSTGHNVVDSTKAFNNLVQGV